MCTAKEEGGIRCHSHALKALKAAQKSGDETRINEATKDYYCTNEGIRELYENVEGNDDFELRYYLEMRITRMETNKIFASSLSDEEKINKKLEIADKRNGTDKLRKLCDAELVKIRRGMAQYAKSEHNIVELFAKGAKFRYKGRSFTSISAGKPTVANGGGEGKTDIYIEAKDEFGKKEEIKISFKQKNADSYENWVSAERAKDILGPAWQQILRHSIKENHTSFKSSYSDSQRISIENGRPAAVLGYAVDIRSKPRTLSTKLNLTHQQKKEIYSGATLHPNKRNCLVDGKRVINSGVATHILVANSIKTPQEAIDKMVSMDEYAKNHKGELYLAYKTVNARQSKGWSAQTRPLAVSVERYKDNDGSIKRRLKYDNPLEYSSKDSLENFLDVNNFKKANRPI